jgi:membrane protease YdiL (CAAX protease family)
VPWLALLVSSLAFGAMHQSFALGAVAGLAFGALRAWRGRVGDAVVAHAAANAAVAVAATAFSQLGLWG